MLVLPPTADAGCSHSSALQYHKFSSTSEQPTASGTQSDVLPHGDGDQAGHHRVHHAGGDGETESQLGAKIWLSAAKYKRQKIKLKKQKISIVFNFSSLILTDSMEKVLNRGLKFCITPLKLDITQILVDYRKFERTMVWREFWHGREQNEDKRT